MDKIRHLGMGLLLAALALPAVTGPGLYGRPAWAARSAKTTQAAQVPKIIKIEVISQSGGIGKKGSVAGDTGEPETVLIRLPIVLAKKAVAKIVQKETKKEIILGGIDKSDFDIADLIDVMEGSKPGDILLEIQTGDGDLIKITLE